MDAKAPAVAPLVWVVTRVQNGDGVLVIGARKDATCMYVRAIREETGAVFAAEMAASSRPVDDILHGLGTGAGLKIVVDATSVSVRVNAAEVRTALVPDADFSTTPAGGVKCSAMQRRWEASHVLQLALLRGLQPK